MNPSLIMSLMDIQKSWFVIIDCFTRFNSFLFYVLSRYSKLFIYKVGLSSYLLHSLLRICFPCFQSQCYIAPSNNENICIKIEYNKYKNNFEHLLTFHRFCRGLYQSTSTGFSSTFHGSPHLFRASMYGSGSNSSTVNTPGRFHVPSRTREVPIMAGTPVV